MAAHTSIDVREERPRGLSRKAAVGVGLLALLCIAAPAGAVRGADPVAGTTELVSITPSGASIEDACCVAINDDGRYVAFTGALEYLGPEQVMVRDRASNTTDVASVNSAGEPGNDISLWPAISADGRVVAFRSDATNLVARDSNQATDIFVHDHSTGVTERASVSSTGAQANGDSGGVSLSADGNLVLFWSRASDLVPGDTNHKADVFLRDRSRGVTERLSVAPDGAQANGDSDTGAISADGRYVVFSSYASNLVPGDQNHTADVFLLDRQLGTLQRISVSADSGDANAASYQPAISANGRTVAFWSDATNIVPGTPAGTHLYVRDLDAGSTERVEDQNPGYPPPEGAAWLSADGRLLAFASYDSTLVPNDTNGVEDVFVLDRASGSITRASVSSDGQQGEGFDSWAPALSADGSTVAFASFAENLVPSAAPGSNAYVHVLGPAGVPVSVALAGDGSGTVTSAPAGISCPAVCSASFPAGSTVTLTAVPGAGSSFAGWSGACAGTDACTLPLGAAQAVTATFTVSAPPSFQLSVSAGGAGTITSTPAGIACGSVCAATFTGGTTVALAALPAPEFVFAGWSGACSGSGACSVTMSRDASVAASFLPEPEPVVPVLLPTSELAAATPALSVKLGGTGLGRVISSPAGIDCGWRCSATWPTGTLVTLSARAGASSRFVGFRGACAGRLSCRVTLDHARQVVATFAPSGGSRLPAVATRPLIVSAIHLTILGRRPWQRLLVRLELSRTAKLRGRLVRGSHPLASSWRWAGRGTRSLVIRIPPGARRGRYTVELAANDTAHHTRLFRRTVRLQT